MGFENALFLTFSHEHTAAALKSVLTLIRRDGGRVHAIAVIPPAPALQRLLTPHEASEQIETTLREALLDDLAGWVTKAAGRAHPAEVSVDVLTGHAVAEVLHRIVDDDHDLLAVTSDPNDPVARAVIKRLQRKSPCPVWAIRPSRARKRRVLAAVDTDPDHHELDHRILAAARWLTQPGDQLHVLTAWELLGESTLRDSPFLGVGPDAVDELRTRCEADHRTTLTELVAEHDFGDLDLQLHVRHGAAADVIIETIDEFGVNQLVLGTIGRTGLPGFVIGNTAERLLSEIECSEFVVKPPGFASPFDR